MNTPQKKYRELVFGLVYALFQEKSDKELLIPLYMKELKVPKKVVLEALKKAELILSKKDVITEAIKKFSFSYSFERIQSIEKIVLFLSVYDLFFSQETPPLVVISEGMRLTKKFSTPESSLFINALLDAIYKDHLGETPSLKEIEEKAHLLEASEIATKTLQPDTLEKVEEI